MTTTQNWAHESRPSEENIVPALEADTLKVMVSAITDFSFPRQTTMATYP
jgi:hypothetical protein